MCLQWTAWLAAMAHIIHDSHVSLARINFHTHSCIKSALQYNITFNRIKDIPTTSPLLGSGLLKASVETISADSGHSSKCQIKKRND